MAKNIPGRDVSGFAPAIQAQRIKALEDSQQNITGLQTDVTTLQGQMTVVQGDVATLQGDVSTIEAHENHEPLDAVVDGGFIGDGTYADTERLINLCRQAFLQGQSVFIPAGIYYLHHPVTLIAETKLLGEYGFWNKHGTILRPAAGFDTGYNTNGVRAALIQTNGIGPDPSGLNRWVYSPADYSHGIQISNIALENSPDGLFDALAKPLNPIANLDGIAWYSPGVNSFQRNCIVNGFATGYHVYGQCGPFTSEICEGFWSTDSLHRFESLHIAYPTQQVGGQIRINNCGGDANTPYWAYYAGAFDINIQSPRLEYAITKQDSIICCDTGLEMVGTGGRYYSTVLMEGAFAQWYSGPAGVTYPPPIDAWIIIKKTGTSNPAEYPDPSITVAASLLWGNVARILLDECTGAFFYTTLAGFGDPRTSFRYCRNTVEKAVSFLGGGHELRGGMTVLDLGLKVVTPSPAAGDVLTSDANGVFTPQSGGSGRYASLAKYGV